MADWSALHAYIHSNYTVSDGDADMIKLVFALDGGRSQLVLVARGGDLEGSEWAVISTAVCKEGDVSPREALIQNSQMLVGGLALIEGGPVIFRYAIRLADLDPAEFEAPIKIAAIFGDKLEQEIAKADQF